MIFGVLVHRCLPAAARAATRVLPVVAMAAICLIIGITIAVSRDDLLRVAPAIFDDSIGINLTGLALGYGCARWLGLNRIEARTVADRGGNAERWLGDRPGVRRTAKSRGSPWRLRLWPVERHQHFGACFVVTQTNCLSGAIVFPGR